MPTLKLHSLHQIKIGKPKPGLLAHLKSSADVEADCAKEVSEAERIMQEKTAAEKARFRDATDSEYWCALVFQTRAQKEAFLAGMEWLRMGDKYLDGQAVAKKMGIVLPAADLKFQGERTDMRTVERIDT